MWCGASSLTRCQIRCSSSQRRAAVPAASASEHAEHQQAPALRPSAPASGTAGARSRRSAPKAAPRRLRKRERVRRRAPRRGRGWADRGSDRKRARCGTGRRRRWCEQGEPAHHSEQHSAVAFLPGPEATGERRDEKGGHQAPAPAEEWPPWRREVEDREIRRRDRVGGHQRHRFGQEADDLGPWPLQRAVCCVRHRRAIVHVGQECGESQERHFFEDRAAIDPPMTPEVEHEWNDHHRGRDFGEHRQAERELRAPERRPTAAVEMAEIEQDADQQPQGRDQRVAADRPAHRFHQRRMHGEREGSPRSPPARSRSGGRGTRATARRRRRAGARSARGSPRGSTRRGRGPAPPRE